MVCGKLNKQIAYELGTSERTVKAHRHAIMEKFKIGSLAELVSIAGALGAPSRIDGGSLTKSGAINDALMLDT